MKYHTIGISGQSASGKTHFLKILMAMLNYNSYSYIDLDGYHYHGRQERLKLNEFPEDINANDINRMIIDIKNVKSGKAIEIPTYNHQIGTVENYIQVTPKPLIFVEGLHTTLLNNLAKERIIDLTFHINPNNDLQKTWKVYRDVLERGYDFETVMKELKGRIEFEKKYVQPQIKESDVIIKIIKNSCQIIHVLLLLQNNKLAISRNIHTLFRLKELCKFDTKYFQLSQKKEYYKSLKYLDQFNLINFERKVLKQMEKNSIEEIVLLSLGLILLFKIDNDG